MITPARASMAPVVKAAKVRGIRMSRRTCPVKSSPGCTNSRHKSDAVNSTLPLSNENSMLKTANNRRQQTRKYCLGVINAILSSHLHLFANQECKPGSGKSLAEVAGDLYDAQHKMSKAF